jgi:hypothetical protein
MARPPTRTVAPIQVSRTRSRALRRWQCKTDKIDARVLAQLSARDLVPETWLPGPGIRRERAPARFRLHLVRHRTTLKNRIHATLITFGHPCPVSDLFGHAGRSCSTASRSRIRGGATSTSACTSSTISSSSMSHPEPRCRTDVCPVHRRWRRARRRSPSSLGAAMKHR